jgi:hypothetical protein
VAALACVAAAAAVLTFTRPVLAVDACPRLVEPEVVAVGERIDVHGSFTDWANPGSVTIVATRADGRVHRFDGAPDGDGTWDIHVQFGWQDVGRWRLRLDQFEAAGSEVCIDSVRVRAPGGGAPDTATAHSVVPPDPQHAGVGLLAALFGVIALSLIARPRRTR